MQKIIPHLWFDTQAKEATDFYTTIFPDSQIIHTSIIPDTPSGDCELVSFELMGMQCMAISAGPYFTYNPALSFMVNFDPSKDNRAREHLDHAWEQLHEGGTVLMEIGTYPFSERYGWIQDRFGFSWQLILTKPEGEVRPPIIPSMLFVDTKYGKAEEASDFYCSVFKDSKRGVLAKYPADTGPNREGTVMFTDFKINNLWIAAMDGGGHHAFDFNEAFSFIIQCDTQEEIDYYWERLSADPEAEQCGWLKDRYGVSWQVTPTMIDEVMQRGDQTVIARVTRAFLSMKKFDIATLRKAYEAE